MTPQCGATMCTAPATRQTYSEAYDATDPWAAAGFALWCAAHAPAGSWAAVASVAAPAPVEPVPELVVIRCRGAHWFAYRRQVGTSSPSCTRYACDAPNPRYDVDRDPYALPVSGDASDRSS